MDLSFNFHIAGSYSNNTTEGLGRKHQMGIYGFIYGALHRMLLADGLCDETVQSKNNFPD